MALSVPQVLCEEAKRKTIHSCGVAIPVVYLFSEKEVIILAFLSAFFIISIIEWLRFRGLIALPFLRTTERKKIAAYVFFMIGAFISILIFEKRIAIAAILMLALGDTVAALAGALMTGDNPWYEKRIKPPEVMLAMFMTSLLIGYLVLGSLPIAVLGTIGATVADGVPLKVQGISVDDNLTIPVFSGILMTCGAMWYLF
ncbi:MAG: hypothetical protein EFT35_03660 [Methanophagales archaeon ANME-1-THS]|nr:MAG: hypothetical protein EFT35_03660 [Methanophagales archaeon ANME-1-THS]